MNRAEIVAGSKAYFREKLNDSTFVPGESYIPAYG